MIITPREYFSYSQMASFKYSKQKFLENYYYGKEQESCYMDLGKRLGTALQFRNKRECRIINQIRKQIPVAEIYEKELKTTFKKIPLLCYLDGFFDSNYTMHEYKTGKAPSMESWRSQMLFYSAALFLLDKKLPNKITLYWCRTEFDDNGVLVLTGEVKEYDIKININEVITFSAEIVKVYNQIVKLCSDEYEQFGILPTQRSYNKNNKLKK